MEIRMAKYDQGGGCDCGLYKECECDKYKYKEPLIPELVQQKLSKQLVRVPIQYIASVSIYYETPQGKVLLK